MAVTEDCTLKTTALGHSVFLSYCSQLTQGNVSVYYVLFCSCPLRDPNREYAQVENMIFALAAPALHWPCSVIYS